MILGNNLIVSIDGVPVAAAKNCKLNISQEFIKACSPTGGRTMEKIPTTYDWSVSVDCLYPNSTMPCDLTDRLIRGTKALLTFTDGSGNLRAGFVYVKNCDYSGNINSLATFNASFESTGPLYYYNKLIAKVLYVNGCQMSLTSSGIEYDFNSSKYLYGVEITPYKKGVFVCYTNEVWAIYDETIYTIRGYISNEIVQELENNRISRGQGNMIVGDLDWNNLIGNPVTILCNANATIYYLYEV